MLQIQLQDLPQSPPADGHGAAVVERQPQKTKPPPLYQVVLLNDDYTPMEFVVMVLQEYGVFTKDVAATKVELVSSAARRNGHPLQCIMEAT
jgi:ATP-dependent Clp protease adaptor protein ClpS